MGCFMFCSVYWDQTHFPQKGTKILLYVFYVLASNMFLLFAIA